MMQTSQGDVLAALQFPSASRPPPPASLFSEHHDPPSALTSASSSRKTNSTRIYCWREGCGSLILLPGVGEWVVSEGGVVGHALPAQSEA